MTDTALTDKCLAEFKFIVQDLPTLPTLSPENSNGKIDIWYLPRDISQSTFNGCNGSNVCSMISILISYLYSKKRLQIPETSIIPFEVLELVSGCIEFGNRMYDLCHQSFWPILINWRSRQIIIIFKYGNSRTLTSKTERWPRTTTLVKTLGTLTQQLVKMTHFLSPHPPRLSVDVMASNLFQHNQHCWGEGGDSRNRLFQQHFQAFITG